MIHTVLKVKDRELKMKMRARDVILVEEKLNKSIIEVISSFALAAESGRVGMLKMKEVCVILWASLQALEHGISENSTLDIIDEYMEDNGLLSLIEPIFECLSKSGILREPKKQEKDDNVGKQNV